MRSTRFTQITKIGTNHTQWCPHDMGEIAHAVMPTMLSARSSWPCRCASTAAYMPSVSAARARTPHSNEFGASVWMRLANHPRID
ncbi:Uncharacterised protein [Mycobacteroides abscessus subsp. abscessus]|nr:Uncharacterised protein [Mycobacteroides abscessus subsp. abscessus]